MSVGNVFLVAHPTRSFDGRFLFHIHRRSNPLDTHVTVVTVWIAVGFATRILFRFERLQTLRSPRGCWADFGWIDNTALAEEQQILTRPEDENDVCSTGERKNDDHDRGDSEWDVRFRTA